MARLRLAQVRKADFGRASARNGIAIGAIAAVALAVGLLIAELPSASKGAAPAGKISGSATVQRRNLVATDTEAGTLSYANPQTVFDRLTGTVTWLPAVGALVKPGGTLFKVSGSPVVLFDGTTPAYRDLSSADTNGADIQELNADLKALGYDPNHSITVDDAWQAATTTAVEAWQNAHGMTQTGTITFGQIVFLPGPQRITTVNTVLGSDGGASSAGSGASLTNVGPPKPEFVDLTTTGTTPAVATGPAPVSPTPATATTAAATATTTTTTTTTTTPPPPTTTTSTTTTTPNCNGLDVPQQNPNLAMEKQHNATKASLPACNNKSGKQSRTPSAAAVLLALLKAETLELKKTLGASGNAGGTGGTGGTGSGGGNGGGGGGTGAGAASSGGSGGGRLGRRWKRDRLGRRWKRDRLGHGLGERLGQRLGHGSGAAQAILDDDLDERHRHRRSRRDQAERGGRRRARDRPDAGREHGRRQDHGGQPGRGEQQLEQRLR